MDRILKAETHSATPKLSALLHSVYGDLQRKDFTPPGINPERLDVHKADMLDQDERRDLARDRYQRLYWESIPENADVRDSYSMLSSLLTLLQQPVLPSIIQHLKVQAELRNKAEEDKKKMHFMKQVPDTKYIRRPSRRGILKTKMGKPHMMFVDVGAEFVDIRDITKRANLAKRKVVMRSRRAERKRSLINRST